VSRDPGLYLDDIVEAIDVIADYTAGLTREQFFASRLVQDAVIRRIEIIGEGARQLPAEITGRFADIPWSDIVGMRNIVIHGYHGVNLERVWMTVQQDLPVLRAAVAELPRQLE
jgi:uncharacterized protein with HEPN domain